MTLPDERSSSVPPRLREGPLWAVTSYFPFDEPPGIKRRLNAFREFRRRLPVPLIVVELSRESTFDLESGEAEVLIQVRGGALLWQKERLLNIALQSLPGHCDTVAWLDCDIIFERSDWFAAARRRLDECALVQPFRRVHHLPVAAPVGGEFSAPPDSTANSLGYLLSQTRLPDEVCDHAHTPPQLRCTPGMAWVARRETVEAHGLYDAMVLGSGDKVMFCAACGRHEAASRAFRMSPPHREHYEAWARPFWKTVRGRVGCLEGDVFHLWHGDLAHRFYQERYDGFQDFQFDPATDIAWNADQVWCWNGDKPGLHAFVRRYFERRRGVPGTDM